MTQREGLEERGQRRKMVKAWIMLKMTMVVTQSRDLMGCYQADLCPLSPTQMCLYLFGVTLWDEKRKKCLTLARAEVGETVQWGGGRGSRSGRVKVGDVVHWMEVGETVLWGGGNRLRRMKVGEVGHWAGQRLGRLGGTALVEVGHNE